MLDDIVRLDSKKLAEQPIKLPDHPYIASLKDFGGDELLAGGVDILSTTLVAKLANASWRNNVLPFVGPVVEKGIFYLRHLHEASKIYSTTPTANRQPFSFYFKNALRDGSDNLVKDLLFHDPLYIGFMALGLHQLPEVPPFMLSAASYTSAVLLVAGIDVLKDEIEHKTKKRQLKKLGFDGEEYYESRFHVAMEKNQQDLIDQFMKEFGITEISRSVYHDTYMQHVLRPTGGRNAKVRIRSRNRRKTEVDNNIWGNNPDKVNSLQVIYTKAREDHHGLDQVRYFPVRKEKLYRLLSGNGAEEYLVGKLRAPNPNYFDITFERLMGRQRELAVCTDIINADRPYYIIELKVYRDTKLLEQAMRYLMVECPIVAVQTNHGKSDLFVSRESK